MTPTEEVLSAVHRDVERAMGQLCLAIVRRRVRAADLIEWAAVLRENAPKLERLSKELSGGAGGPKQE